MTEAVRIGIDVGGTNTDAVLMSGKEVVASAKTATRAKMPSASRSAPRGASASGADIIHHDKTPSHGVGGRRRRAEKQKRMVRARPETLALAQSWIEQQRAHWTAALDRLEAVLAAETPKGRKT